jgi:hypothetical protein
MFGYRYGLEYICSYTLTLRPEVIGPLPEGIRINFHITGGEVNGPKLHGRFRPVGADFMIQRSDGVAVLDIRATIETHDGALIYEVGSGLSYSPEGGHEGAMKEGLPVTTPVRVAIRLSTAHPEYLWVNRLQFIAIAESNRDRDEVEVRADLYALK